MSPGAILLCALYILSGAVVFVLILRAICDQPAAEGADGGQQRSAAAPPALTEPAAPPIPLLALPYFPYPARGCSGRHGSETVVCSGQPCSEVPACRHTFHGDCVGAWARSSNSCPLCRVKIVRRSDGAAAAHDMA